MQTKSKSGIQYIFVAAVLVIMVIFSRGTFLGNIALKISFFAGVLCFVYAIATKNTFDARSAYVLLSCLLFFGYCFTQGIILNEASEYKFIIENMVYWTLNAVVAALLLSRASVEKRFGKTFILVLSLSVISYFITMLLGFVIPLNAMKLATVDYGYFYDAPVYFPITVAYGSGKVGSIDVIRMLGFGRECGISQSFYIWAFFKCEDYFRRFRIIRLVMGFGILFCFSTTGLVIFAVAFVAYIVLKHKRGDKMTKYIILIAVIAFVLLFSGTYSISNRLDKSYGDRMDNIRLGFDLLKESPIFGYGYMRPTSLEGDLSEICLLSSVGKIGIVGLVLFLGIYLVAFIMSGDKKKFIICNSGFFLTALLAQPLYAVPLIYVFLFVDYSKESNEISSLSEYCNSSGE